MLGGAWGKVTELLFANVWAARWFSFLGFMSPSPNFCDMWPAKSKKTTFHCFSSMEFQFRPWVRRAASRARPSGFEVEATILKKSRSDSEVLKIGGRGVDGFQTKILCFHGYFSNEPPVFRPHVKHVAPKKQKLSQPKTLFSKTDHTPNSSLLCVTPALQTPHPPLLSNRIQPEIGSLRIPLCVRCL